LWVAVIVVAHAIVVIAHAIVVIVACAVVVVARAVVVVACAVVVVACAVIVVACAVIVVVAGRFPLRLCGTTDMLADEVRVTIADPYRLSTAEGPFRTRSIAKLSAGDILACQPLAAAQC